MLTAIGFIIVAIAAFASTHWIVHSLRREGEPDEKSSRIAWVKLQQTFGFDSDDSLNACRLNGSLRSREVTLVLAQTQSVTVSVGLASEFFAEFSLTPQTFLTSLSKSIDVKVGDPAFDDAVVVDGTQELTLALLNLETRAALIPWVKRHALTVVNASLTAKFSVEQLPRGLTASDVEDLVRLAEYLDHRAQDLASVFEARFRESLDDEALVFLRTLLKLWPHSAQTARCVADAAKSPSLRLRQCVSFSLSASEKVSLLHAVIASSEFSSAERMELFHQLGARERQEFIPSLVMDASLGPDYRHALLKLAVTQTLLELYPVLIANESTEASLRAEALTQFALAVPPSKSAELVEQAVKSSQPELVSAAIRLIERLRFDALWPEVRQRVLDANAALAIRACEAVGSRGDVEDERLLVLCLQRRSWGHAPGSDDVLCAAATALGAVGTLKSVMHLNELSTKVIASTNTRTAALASIRAIQDRAGPVDAGRVSLLPSAVDEGAVSVASDVGALGLAGDARDKDKVPS